MECFVLDSTATNKTENKIFNNLSILFLIKVENKATHEGNYRASH